VTGSDSALFSVANAFRGASDLDGIPVNLPFSIPEASRGSSRKAGPQAYVKYYLKTNRASMRFARNLLSVIGDLRFVIFKNLVRDCAILNGTRIHTDFADFHSAAEPQPN
jgi:hypothetical protein